MALTGDGCGLRVDGKRGVDGVREVLLLFLGEGGASVGAAVDLDARDGVGGGSLRLQFADDDVGIEAEDEGAGLGIVEVEDAGDGHVLYAGGGVHDFRLASVGQARGAGGVVGEGDLVLAARVAALHEMGGAPPVLLGHGVGGCSGHGAGGHAVGVDEHDAVEGPGGHGRLHSVDRGDRIDQGDVDVVAAVRVVVGRGRRRRCRCRRRCRRIGGGGGIVGILGHQALHVDVAVGVRGGHLAHLPVEQTAEAEGAEHEGHAEGNGDDGHDEARGVRPGVAHADGDDRAHARASLSSAAAPESFSPSSENTSRIPS